MFPINTFKRLWRLKLQALMEANFIVKLNIRFYLVIIQIFRLHSAESGNIQMSM